MYLQYNTSKNKHKKIHLFVVKRGEIIGTPFLFRVMSSILTFLTHVGCRIIVKLRLMLRNNYLVPEVSSWFFRQHLRKIWNMKILIKIVFSLWPFPIQKLKLWHLVFPTIKIIFLMTFSPTTLLENEMIKNKKPF